MLLLTAGFTALGLVVVVCGLAAPNRPRPAASDPVEERMRYYGTPAPEEPDPIKGSFHERILQGPGDRLRQIALRWTPARYQERTRAALEMAGHPYRLTISDFMAVRLTLAVGGLAVGIGLGVVVVNVLVAAILAGGLAAGAWTLVGVWLRQAGKARQRSITAALPEAIDLIVVAVDAGLNFELAMGRVVEKFHNPLTDGVVQVIAETRLGRSREDALAAYARRTGVDELNGFVQAVLNSERMGVPLAQTLRLQADEMRWRRRERVRTKGAQAPLKMTVPMVVFIFPTIWLVLLGPALLQIFYRGL